jgi:hypothetical protein
VIRCAKVNGNKNKRRKTDKHADYKKISKQWEKYNVGKDGSGHNDKMKVLNES